MWVAKVYTRGIRGEQYVNTFVGERWECAIYVYSYRSISRTYSILKEV